MARDYSTLAALHPSVRRLRAARESRISWWGVRGLVLRELIDFEVLVLAGAFVMLLFPDGHLLSRRWRIVAWMALCAEWC